MSYIGIADDTIRKLAIEAMRHEEGDNKYEKKKFVTFKKKELPKQTRTLDKWLEEYTVGTLQQDQQKKIDSSLEISMAPTQQEALDLIEMERIERLLNL